MQSLQSLLSIRERVRAERLLRNDMSDPADAMREFYAGRDKVQATSAFLHTMHWSLEILLVRASETSGSQRAA